MKRYDANQIRLIWNVIIVAVLAVGLYVVWLLPGIDLKAAGVQPTSPRNEAVCNGASRQNTLSAKEMQSFIRSLQESRTTADPFLRSGEEEWKIFLGELKARPPRLQGIIIVQGTRTAIIDGSRYLAGDDVKGFTVADVGETEVVLVKDGKYYTIHLAQ